MLACWILTWQTLGQEIKLCQLPQKPLHRPHLPPTVSNINLTFIGMPSFYFSFYTFSTQMYFHKPYTSVLSIKKSFDMSFKALLIYIFLLHSFPFFTIYLLKNVGCLISRTFPNLAFFKNKDSLSIIYYLATQRCGSYKKDMKILILSFDFPVFKIKIWYPHMFWRWLIPFCFDVVINSWI